MAARIKADLQRIDAALKASLGHRGSLARLRAGSLEAWSAISTSLSDVTLALTSSAFADPGDGAAATWVHWRKTSTSKQLLSLLQTVIEEVHVAEPATAWGSRSCAAHGSFLITWSFFVQTRSAALWPAMRGWLVDQGGMQSVWTALAWCLSSREHNTSNDIVQIRNSIRATFSLTLYIDSATVTASLPQHPDVVIALRLIFSDILPADFAAGSAHLWQLRDVLSSVSALSRSASGSSLASLLHRPLLVAWPYLIAALRQGNQQLQMKDTEVRGAFDACAHTALRGQGGSSTRLEPCNH